MLLLVGCGGSQNAPPPPAPATCSLPEGFALGAPVSAPRETWTWVSVPGTRCRNGATSGFGINPRAGSKKLLIYLEGGGACFNPATCATNDDGRVATGPNVEYYGNAGKLFPAGFNRNDAENPFRDFNFVYVPYCTGDVHAGSNAAGPGSDGQFHVGFVNVRRDLERIVSTFPDPEHVVLAGFSAGGYGAQVNFNQVQHAFGCNARVDLLVDSAPLLGNDVLAPCLQSAWRARFDLGPAIPADCPECDERTGGSLAALTAWNAKAFPKSRQALLDGVTDDVMRYFFSFGYDFSKSPPVMRPATPACPGLDLSPAQAAPLRVPADDYATGLSNLVRGMSGHANFHAFGFPTNRHGVVDPAFWNVTIDARSDLDEKTPIRKVTARQWLTQMVSGDAAWVDAVPVN